MKIAVLISGGVDSAVAVDRLVKEGHDLHLFYIRIGLDTSQGGECAAEEDIEMCRLIARRYNLPFDEVSLHEEYWDHVMEYALRTVREGLTPNPDMMCNKMIKFGFFEERWGHEFDLTATGHYATTRVVDGVKYLATAVDPVKDQTDFLAQITYPQLQHLIFPIGDMPKADVRRAAIDAHLPNATRKDSQGICFLGKINYNDFLERHLGTRRGPIIELETGRKLGEHRGFWFHTIGQRKGLGLSGGPWYVVKKNVHDNVVYVSQGYGTQRQYGNLLPLTEMHFISGNPWPDACEGVDIMFKNRHMPEFLKARLTRTVDTDGQTGYIIESERPVQGIAPGQFAVIYDKDANLCYGSGVITGENVVL
ncbi:MAG: tRNA 2-thiouridine(34) synthase MnmA [Muribaculum sp.]|nr:tRNA 2-thiouridine(34) synthase MnmA [Muribaculum sp.]